MSNKEDLDRLINNLGEVGLTSLIQALSIYMEESFLNEFKKRIETEEMNPKFEWKMRGVAEFKQHIEKYLKD